MMQILDVLQILRRNEKIIREMQQSNLEKNCNNLLQMNPTQEHKTFHDYMGLFSR